MARWRYILNVRITIDGQQRLAGGVHSDSAKHDMIVTTTLSVRPIGANPWQFRGGVEIDDPVDVAFDQVLRSTKC